MFKTLSTPALKRGVHTHNNKTLYLRIEQWRKYMTRCSWKMTRCSCKMTRCTCKMTRCSCKMTRCSCKMTRCSCKGAPINYPYSLDLRDKLVVTSFRINIIILALLPPPFFARLINNRVSKIWGILTQVGYLLFRFRCESNLWFIFSISPLCSLLQSQFPFCHNPLHSPLSSDHFDALTEHDCSPALFNFQAVIVRRRSWKKLTSDRCSYTHSNWSSSRSFD